MRLLINTFFSIFLVVFSQLSCAAPEDIIYDFETNSFPAGFYPDLDFTGPASGQVVTSYANTTGEYTLEKLIINFAHMPTIVAQNFIQQDIHTYVAHVKNAWIFRSIKVVVDSPDTFNFPLFVHVRIFVDYQESYVGDIESSNNQEGPMLVDLPIEPKQRISFTAIDVYRTTFEDKAVILKLNKNITRRVNPENGAISEGIELEVTWFGHGTGYFYFPLPLDYSIKPFAIKTDLDVIPPNQPESIWVAFQQNGNTMDSPIIPLNLLLQEAVATTTP